MRAHPRLYLTAIVLISAACGGRFTQTGDDGGEGATGSGGGNTGTGAGTSTGARPTGTGGKSVSTGGTATGIGGKATGTGGKATGTGGKATGTGGKATCLDLPCPDIDCAPGYVPVPDPSGCCKLGCRSLCEGTACPGIACGSGSHLEVLPDQCCPTCVPDNCEEQRANYNNYRQQLIDKYSASGCMRDNDCAVFYEKNDCAVGCGISVPRITVDSLVSNLESYAKLNCNPNCMQPVPPCEPPSPPTCFKAYWCE